ncbi:hypothetical protein A7X67_15675 [Clostridium sp. W14A]|nr:hypothetical protein A7X67_15675 [Clostridium sp. W14A]
MRFCRQEVPWPSGIADMRSAEAGRRSRLNGRERSLSVLRKRILFRKRPEKHGDFFGDGVRDATGISFLQKKPLPPENCAVTKAPSADHHPRSVLFCYRI